MEVHAGRRLSLRCQAILVGVSDIVRLSIEQVEDLEPNFVDLVNLISKLEFDCSARRRINRTVLENGGRSKVPQP